MCHLHKSSTYYHCVDKKKQVAFMFPRKTYLLLQFICMNIICLRQILGKNFERRNKNQFTTIVTTSGRVNILSENKYDIAMIS